MRKDAFEFLGNLLNAPSPSGYEGPARDVWLSYTKRFADKVQVDVHGNAIATINPKGGPHVMLAGHMDEIGFQVCYISEKGFIRFRPIGGHDLRAIAGRRVHIHTDSGPVFGVIGKKPIHLITDRGGAKKPPKASDLWIDAGFANKRAAEKVVSIGDPITYTDGFEQLRNKQYVARAFDNKAGAFIVAEVLRTLSKAKGLKAKVSAVATVQEEIGLRGATTSAYGLEPDVGFAVDVTWATDDPSSDPKEIGEVALGKGPVVVRGPNVNPPLLKLIKQTASKQKIPYQLRAIPRGSGNDGNAMQLSRAGIAVGIIGVPQRYMHSPVEVCHLGDLDQIVSLIAGTIKRLTPRTSLIP